MMADDKRFLVVQFREVQEYEDALNDYAPEGALKPDRIAVEHNGSIVSRPAWPTTPIADGDKFEIVHFVGGGSP